MYLNYRLFILFFFSEIGLAFNTLGKDPDCRVIILSGNGKAFCSGIDLKDLMDVGNIINSDEDTARKSLKLRLSKLVHGNGKGRYLWAY